MQNWPNVLNEIALQSQYFTKVNCPDFFTHFYSRDFVEYASVAKVLNNISEWIDIFSIWCIYRHLGDKRFYVPLITVADGTIWPHGDHIPVCDKGS